MLFASYSDICMVYTRSYPYIICLCVCVYYQKNITKIKMMTFYKQAKRFLDYIKFQLLRGGMYTCIQGLGNVGEELKIKQGFSRCL